jgi:hypothetical protein
MELDEAIDCPEAPERSLTENISQYRFWLFPGELWLMVVFMLK